MAACLWQRDGFCPDAVELEVPGGKVYRPDVVPHEDGSCGIIKDSADAVQKTAINRCRRNSRRCPGAGSSRFIGGRKNADNLSPLLLIPVVVRIPEVSQPVFNLFNIFYNFYTFLSINLFFSFI